MPCSPLEWTNPTEPGPICVLLPSTVSSTVPSRISHISVWRWRCGGMGEPPGGRGVSLTSQDSPDGSLSFMTSPITREVVFSRDRVMHRYNDIRHNLHIISLVFLA